MATPQPGSNCYTNETCIYIKYKAQFIVMFIYLFIYLLTEIQFHR